MSVAPGIAIRLAVPADAGELLKLWQAAGASPGSTDTIGHVTAAIEWPGCSVLVADASARIVGSLIAAWDGWRGNMYRLAVLSEFRRAGIASALVSEGERRLVERGVRRVAAIVLGEPAATAFWEQAGYSVQVEAGRMLKNL
jgi:ribosomal protein S18 acetylase RimI-like enzyme